jgi:mannose-1-phosphate guanylyltransferase
MEYAIILAGGIGSRFWPLSRESLPKQFLRIVEKQSLIEATVRRIQKIIPEDNLFIVTNNIYLNTVKNQLKNFNIPKNNIILEPRPRNTLPAISLCAQIIRLKDPKAKLLVLPSDHYIKDDLKFKQAMKKALAVASDGFLCLIGVKPNSPRLGYGYINISKSKNEDIFYVKSFKEKPKPKEAKRLLKIKGVFWNSGIFCFKAGVLLEELKKYLPSLYYQIIKIEQKEDIIKVWSKIKSVSIDYGLLEKSKNLVMVVGKFDWSDLGSWDALSDLLPKDRKNNTILSDCDCVSLDVNNTLVCSYEHKRLIAALGLKDLIIVDTPDALLVCRKDKTQDIKRLVEVLKKKRKKCV